MSRYLVKSVRRVVVVGRNSGRDWSTWHGQFQAKISSLYSITLKGMSDCNWVVSNVMEACRDKECLYIGRLRLRVDDSNIARFITRRTNQQCVKRTGQLDRT